jgi:hypothetical protein
VLVLIAAATAAMVGYTGAEPPAAPAASEQPAGVVIVNQDSYWRYWCDRRGVFVKLDGGESVPLDTHFGQQQYGGIYKPLATPKSAKPSADHAAGGMVADEL